MGPSRPRPRPRPRPRRSKAADEGDTSQRKKFDIPYFAHQRLDPAHFPPVGLAIGGPPAANLHQGRGAAAKDWEDPDSDADMVIESSDDGQLPFNDGKNPGSSNKRGSTGLVDRAAKRRRVAEGRPAISKRVTADLDSDDELIVRMKNAKYQEKDIAKRLADEGRVLYNTKTIGSRWGRLRKVLQARQDELLDASLTDWHDGDDDVLHEAIKKADQTIEKAIQELRERKWRLVADNMKSIKPVTNFSRNACEKRFHDLQAGTAKPTPESVPNPSPAMRARIEARRERERKIEADRKQMCEQSMENMQQNGWVSKPCRF